MPVLTSSAVSAPPAAGTTKLGGSMQAEVNGSWVSVNFAELARLRSSEEVNGVRIQGQIVQRRCHGKKVCFFDVQERAYRPEDPMPESIAAEGLVELVADEKNLVSESEGAEQPWSVRSIFRAAHLGDIVRTWGKLRAAEELVVEITGIEVIESWKEMADLSHPFVLKIVRPRITPARGGDEGEVKVPIVGSVARPCKFFITQGCCDRPECSFAHVPGATREWADALKKRRALASQNPDDPHSALDKGSHQQRARIFANWIVETYDLEALRRGGVLDVAGGRGELAFELTLGFSIPVTVVDPRPLKLSKPQSKRLKQAHGVDSEAAKVWLHEHIPSFQTELNEDFLLEGGQRATLEKAAVIVGLHPDQATGAICEYALRHGRPFAVVPCCVFSDMFPERKLPGEAGERLVRTHEDLCRWIRARDSKIEDGFLNFEGKNQVVFMRAPASQ